MNWYCCPAAIWMAELLVRTALPDLYESQTFKSRDNFARLEDGQRAQIRLREPFASR